MWNVKPGDKLVCIDDSNQEYESNFKDIHEGEIYEVEQVVPDFIHPRGETYPLTVHLVGIRNELIRIPFRIDRFRPLVREETMDDLKKLLDVPMKELT